MCAARVAIIIFHNGQGRLSFVSEIGRSNDGLELLQDCAGRAIRGKAGKCFLESMATCIAEAFPKFPVVDLELDSSFELGTPERHVEAIRRLLSLLRPPGCKCVRQNFSKLETSKMSYLSSSSEFERSELPDLLCDKLLLWSMPLLGAMFA